MVGVTHRMSVLAGAVVGVSNYQYASYTVPLGPKLPS